MNCVQYCDRDYGRQRIVYRSAYLTRAAVWFYCQLARPAGDVSALSLSLSLSLYVICAYMRIRIDIYVYRYLLARISLGRGLTRGKNVEQARRALGNDRPPSVLNNGHYALGYNSLGYRAPTGVDSARETDRPHDEGETRGRIQSVRPRGAHLVSQRSKVSRINSN